MELPPPTDFSRQVGVSSPTSPLSRATTYSSDRSEIHHPDHEMREHLLRYKTFLEHEITFVDSEIQALLDKKPSEDTAEEQQWLQLRQNLKVRYNTLQHRLARVRALLELL